MADEREFFDGEDGSAPDFPQEMDTPDDEALAPGEFPLRSAADFDQELEALEAYAAEATPTGRTRARGRSTRLGACRTSRFCGWARGSQRGALAERAETEHAGRPLARSTRRSGCARRALKASAACATRSGCCRWSCC